MRSNFSAFEEDLLPYTFEKKNILLLFEIALLIEGHVLIEDLPGVGKTTFSKAFAKLLGKKFSRIQGTSDLLPSDILGGETVNLKTKEISIRKGPIFSELVLIDEINRMHPKTQSAFLEAMEEKTVTLAGENFSLPLGHMIMATQNPIEQEGTNVLPEAQRDRFACKISIGLPPEKIQIQMIQNDGTRIEDKINILPALLSPQIIQEAQLAVRKIFIEDQIAKKIIQFVEWTRTDEIFKYGVSPRGATILARAMRANAFLQGRDFVIPEDGLSLLFPFLAHRIETKENIPNDILQNILEEKYKQIF